MLFIFRICIINYLILSLYGFNNSFYKISLTQKGYTQFLEYDVDVPSISEFTFCLWLRVLNLDNDQNIFSYIGESNNRIINVWLETGGTNLKMSINKNVYSTVSVDWQIGAWQYLCISYQSELGAWAIYIDGNLVSCDASRTLVGSVLPGGGNILIGFSNPINGLENGFEGDIYGFNLVLESTIEKQNWLKKNKLITRKPLKDKKTFLKNKFKYIVLGDLVTAKTNEILHESSDTGTTNNKKNHIHFATPFSVIDHDVGKITKLMENNRNDDKSKEMEILDIPTLNNENSNLNDKKLNIWNVINKAGNLGKFKKTHFGSIKPVNSLPIIVDSTSEISIFETPPPLGVKNQYFNNEKPNVFSIKQSKFNDDFKSLSLIDVEIPPPISKSNDFRDWQSTSFADDVLNYIKQSKKKNKYYRKVPDTIPLTKISDSFPYSSNVNKKSSKYRSNYIHRKYNLKKRDIGKQEKNLKIEYYDFRSDILNSHAKTEPKEVTITYRGDPIKEMDVRFYRNIKNEKLLNPRPFMPINHKTNPIVFFNKSLLKSANNSNPTISQFYKEMYIRSLNQVNKWHNSNLNNDNIENIELKNNINKYLSNKMIDKTAIDQNEVNIINDIKIARPHTFDASNFSDLKNMSAKSFKIKYNTRNNFDKNIKIGHALDERNIIGISKTENELSFLGGDDRVPDINHYRSDIDGINTITLSIPPSLRFKACSNAVINDNNPNEAIEFVMENYYTCTIGKKNHNNQLVLLNWIETPVRLFGGALPKKTTNICLV